MKEKDPYLLTDEDAKDIQKDLKMAGVSVFCPRMNKKLMSGTCHVCESLKPFWNFPKFSKEWNLAASKSAKVNFFLVVTFRNNPDVPIVLEMGKNAGNEILDGINSKGWVDITHPKGGKGREMTITKSVSGGFNQYKASPDLNKADWDVPEETIKNAPNLDNIIDMLRNNKLEEGKNYMRISSLKIGETIKFRILPANPETEIFPRKIAIGWVYRHYAGVTQAEVDGETELDLTVPDKNEKTDTPTPKKEVAPWEDEPKHQEKKEEVREKCWGVVELFEEADAQCKACRDFKSCYKEVLRKRG